MKVRKNRRKKKKAMAMPRRRGGEKKNDHQPDLKKKHTLFRPESGGKN